VPNRTTEAAITLGPDALAWCLDRGLFEGWPAAREDQREAMLASARSAYETSVGPVVERPVEVVVNVVAGPALTTGDDVAAAVSAGVASAAQPDPPATVEPVAGAAPVEADAKA